MGAGIAGGDDHPVDIAIRIGQLGAHPLDLARLRDGPPYGGIGIVAGHHLHPQWIDRGRAAGGKDARDDVERIALHRFGIVTIDHGRVDVPVGRFQSDNAQFHQVTFTRRR